MELMAFRCYAVFQSSACRFLEVENLDVWKEGQSAVSRSRPSEGRPTLKGAEEGHSTAHGALPPVRHFEGFVGLPVAHKNVFIAFPAKCKLMAFRGSFKLETLAQTNLQYRSHHYAVSAY